MNSSLLQLTLQVAGRLRVKVIELPSQDRDHVPGHVLDHLGIFKAARLHCPLALVALPPAVDWLKGVEGSITFLPIAVPEQSSKTQSE